MYHHLADTVPRAQSAFDPAPQLVQRIKRRAARQEADAERNAEFEEKTAKADQKHAKVALKKKLAGNAKIPKLKTRKPKR